MKNLRSTYAPAGLSGFSGFSLVEVMVAVVVICVGLLGIAKMQSLSLSNMTTSRLRSLAAFEAAGLAAAMHTNRDYWVTTTPATITVNPAVIPVIASSDGALAAQASADLGNLNACVNPGAVPACTPINLAAYDLARWVNSLKGLLPNPTAAISCPPVVGSAPTNCTIQITWGETAVAMTKQEAQYQAANNVGQFERPSYLLYVEP
jgi:type IV pilus assembly protein PilV